jgi:formylglycine-generating enzyme required for sulfatase activity
MILDLSAANARILRIKSDEVNALEEPDVQSEVVDSVYKNELYQITDRKSGWYQLKLYGNKKGWVPAYNVEVKGEKIATPEAKKTVLNLDTIYSNSYAVIIAIDNYMEIQDIDYAKKDAAYLKSKLKTIGFKKFIELYDKSATYANITNLLERELLKIGRGNDRIFIFFAGRSYSKEVSLDIYEGYILPFDAKRDNIEGTSFSIEVLDAFFAKLLAKHVLIVYDTCFSGLALKKAVSIPQNMPGYLLNVASRKGRQIITAGKHKNEMVTADGQSLFVKTLVEGINGSAEQGVPDGIVTGSELGAYLKLKVSIKSRRKQTPDFGRVQGGDKGGEFIFTRRKGSINVTQEIKQFREEAVAEEEVIEELFMPEERMTFTEEEIIEDYEVAGPLPLFPGELVVIPGGDFQIGSMDGHINEKPVHTVYLDSYYITRYEITNKEYKEFIDSTGYPPPVNVEGPESEYNLWIGRDYPKSMENQPVVNVSWYDAVTYCKWLTGVTGENYRLPTEAEWEKAARGTDQRIYPWGNKSPNYQRCNFNSEWKGSGTFFNVGYFDRGKSPYWVYEMGGNVWEWCSDWYLEDAYLYSERSNPKGPESSGSKVVRGGSWASTEDSIRSSARYGYFPDLRSARGGFRVVLEPER